MDKQTKHREKSIELRSEKVRNIVGQIPSLLIRQGILIIGLVLLILLSISAFVPYIKILPVDITVYTVPQVEKVRAPADGIFLIDTLFHAKSNQKVGNVLYGKQLLPVQHASKGYLIWNVQNNDRVQKNDLLFVVEPQNIEKIYGECYVPLSQKNMLQQGQKVILTDDWGHHFNAWVSVIYPIPNNLQQLKVKIEIDNLQRNKPQHKLQGKIVLLETTFLERFVVNSFRK